MRMRIPSVALLVAIAATACTDRADTPTTPRAPSNAVAATASDAEMARTAQALGYVPGRVLARFRSGAPIASLAGAQGASVERSLIAGTRVLRVPVGREATIAEALSRSPHVEFAEPDLFYTLDVPCGTGRVAERPHRTIGAGGRGPITKTLQTAFFDVVAGKDAKYERWLRYV